VVETIAPAAHAHDWLMTLMSKRRRAPMRE
jgi:hypothetical protein